EDLPEVARQLWIGEEQARVAVLRNAIVRPVVATEKNALAVGDDALGVAVRLHLDTVHVEAVVLQLLERLAGLGGDEVAEDDSHLHPRALPGEDRVHQRTERGLAIMRQVESLVLKKKLLLGFGDQVERGAV